MFHIIIIINKQKKLCVKLISLHVLLHLTQVYILKNIKNKNIPRQTECERWFCIVLKITKGSRS